MLRRIFIVVVAALILSGVALSQKKSTKKTPSTQTQQADQAQFSAQMQQLEHTWVEEFNAGHADKVTALYAPDAVLMRWDGTVHGQDSILAEFQRSAAAGIRGYTVYSLRSERSGDLGYDTGAYNVTLRDRVAEGNYLLVVKNIGGQWKIVAHATVANPRTP